jgi:hypothetical protein
MQTGSLQSRLSIGREPSFQTSRASKEFHMPDAATSPANSTACPPALGDSAFARQLPKDTSITDYLTKLQNACADQLAGQRCLAKQHCTDPIQLCRGSSNVKVGTK